jgi:regulator of sirC expression with transglutaminase-like and TPR domain
MQCYRAALRDLTDYVTREPDAADVEEMRAKLIELSSLCARLN